MNHAQENGPAGAIVVSFSGADGSGKTTLANRVAARLRELGPSDLEVQRLWLRWNPKGKLSKRESDVESTLDVRHKGNLAKRVFTQLHAGPVWATAAERLYDYQLRLQIGAVPDKQIVVADRFVPDFYADLVSSGAVSLSQIKRRAALFHPAAACYLVDVPDDVLLSRRAPQEDPDRMIARSELYRQIAPELGLEVIDPLTAECDLLLAKRLLATVRS
jgi:thymidylate kinase